jgi:hypothetical protein
MPGFLRRLLGGQDATPPSFTVELPDGWVGGYGTVAYVEALVKYARAHPECHDPAFVLIKSAPADVSYEYLAAPACDADAVLTVTADDFDADMISADDALALAVTAHLESLASYDIVEGPTSERSTLTVNGGRLVRWTWRLEWPPPSSSSLYAFASGGRIWQLRFESDAETAVDYEASFRAIVGSFRVLPVMQPQ